MNNEEEQFEIFVTLMATRAYITSKEDVESVEVEKYFKNSEDVLNAWKHYNKFLEENDLLNPNTSEKRIDLLVDLLQKMAYVFDYDIDTDHIKSTCQSKIPMDHSEEQDMHIRQEMIEMLSLREEYS